MLSYDELRGRVAINANALSEQCSNHPELFMEAGDLASEARAAAKAAKHNLEQVQATVQLGYRNGTTHTEAKITETSILALVATDLAVIKAKRELVETELLSSKCDSLVNAYDHRRSMLTNEVTLATQTFYQTGDIKSRRVLNEATEEEIRKRRAEEHGRGESES